MYDFAVVNHKPGTCEKCKGTGVYRWGTFTNGKAAHEGMCFSCKGTGKQDAKQMKVNETYNRHKVVNVF